MSDATESIPESRIYTPTSYFEPLPIEKIFGQKQPLEVEIGCGTGTFLAEYAAQETERNFLGIERLLGRVRKVNKKSVRRGLLNVAIVRVEASYAIQYFLEEQSVQAFHIYFPDPWPKRKHWKNRLVAPPLLPLLERCLTPEGKVYLRTDNRDYYEQMLETFEGSERFAPIEAPSTLTAIRTDFEKGFNEQGIPTLYCQYRLSSD